MKTIIVRLLFAVLLFTAADPLFAPIIIFSPISQIDQFKITIYSQTNATPPVAPDNPDAHFFGAYIFTDAGSAVTNVVVYSPGDGVLDLIQRDLAYFENGSDYYSNEADFDTDFPGGTYDYNYDYTDADSNVINADIYFDISTDNLYPDTIPAFTPDCWNAMQHVDPAQDFTLSWNGYDLTPGADYAFTFLNIYDLANGNSIPGPSGPPEETSTNIPAGTLEYGRVYYIGLYFSERQTPEGSGFVAGGITSGWDDLTQTTMTTIAPWLKINATGTNVILTWPALATNYQIETTAGLSATNVWNGSPGVPVVIGSINQLTLPATNRGAFFRLAPLGF